MNTEVQAGIPGRRLGCFPEKPRGLELGWSSRVKKTEWIWDLWEVWSVGPTSVLSMDRYE